MLSGENGIENGRKGVIGLNGQGRAALSTRTTNRNYVNCLNLLVEIIRAVIYMCVYVCVCVRVYVTIAECSYARMFIASCWTLVSTYEIQSPFRRAIMKFTRILRNTRRAIHPSGWKTRTLAIVDSRWIDDAVFRRSVSVSTPFESFPPLVNHDIRATFPIILLIFSLCPWGARIAVFADVLRWFSTRIGKHQEKFS